MKLALDLDGTLITCEPRQSAVLRASLLAFGVLTDPTRVWQLKQNGESTESALIKLGIHAKAARAVSTLWKTSIEDPFWLTLDTVIHGVHAVLQGMIDRGYCLVLLTARGHPRRLLQQLHRLELLPILSQIVVVDPSKTIQHKAKWLSDNSPVAFFGDTESDASAARLAQVKFYCISAGQRGSSFLQAHSQRLYPSLSSAWHAFQTEHCG